MILDKCIHLICCPDFLQIWFFFAFISTILLQNNDYKQLNMFYDPMPWIFIGHMSVLDWYIGKSITE